MLDDPSYIKGLSDSTFLNAHENVFVFSSHLASLEVLQMLSLFIAPSGFADVGQQMHHFVLGEMECEKNKVCDDNCFFQGIIGKADYSGIEVYGRHKVAEKARSLRKKSRNNN